MAPIITHRFRVSLDHNRYSLVLWFSFLRGRDLAQANDTLPIGIAVVDSDLRDSSFLTLVIDGSLGYDLGRGTCEEAESRLGRRRVEVVLQEQVLVLRRLADIWQGRRGRHDVQGVLAAMEIFIDTCRGGCGFGVWQCQKIVNKTFEFPRCNYCKDLMVLTI